LTISTPARRIAAFWILLVSLAAPIRGAAKKSEPDRPVAPGVQRERVSLVLVDVVVTDASGRPVTDLRREDFTLLVDGNAVKIQSVDLQIAGRPEAEAGPGEAAPEAPAPAPSGPSGSPPAPRTTLPRPIPRPRGIVLFFDGLNSEHGLGLEAINSARKFLKEGVQEGDEVMVIGLGAECRIYQSFTSDLSKTLAALDTMEKDPGLRMGGENRFFLNKEQLVRAASDQALGQRALVSPEALESMGRTFVQEDKARARRFIAALQALTGFLSSRPGRKEVFLFSDGFSPTPELLYGVSQPVGMEPELLRAAQEAASAQTALNTVNTRGMPAGPPDDPQVTFESEGTRMLATLSINSGGVLTHGVNRGFERPMRRIEEQTRSTYVLSYSPQGEPDGKMHSTLVRVARKGVKVRSQQGYVWMTEEQRRETETVSAYFAPDLFRKIPLALEADSYLAADGKPRVNLAIAFPSESLLMVPREGHRYARLEAGIVLQSPGGKAEEPAGRSAEVRLPGAAEKDPGDLTLLLRRSVPAGEYEATAVVRDLESGDVGALRTQVKIPPLDAEHLSMSSLILSRSAAPGRRIDLDPPDKGEPEFPRPEVRRIFDSHDQVSAFALVYHPRRDPAAGEVRVTVYAQIHRGREIIRHLTPARQILKAGAGSAATLTVKLPVDLTGLEPGVYELEVEAWDEVEKRGIAQFVEFMVR
jgi:VWFA-related protein